MARDKEGMDMARHTRWTNADLIKGMLCVKYYGYKAKIEVAILRAGAILSKIFWDFILLRVFDV